jgi:hypothetical protein
MQHHPHHHQHDSKRDRRERNGGLSGSATGRGYCFTPVDVLVVAFILAMLGSMMLFAAGGLNAAEVDPGCVRDAHALDSAAEIYFGERHTLLIAATGDDHDRYERTLVEAGLLPSASRFHDLDADGAVKPEGESSCSRS